MQDFWLFNVGTSSSGKRCANARGLSFSPLCVLRCRSRFTNERWGPVTGESEIEDLVRTPRCWWSGFKTVSALTYLERVLVCRGLQQASRETLRWILILSEGDGEKSQSSLSPFLSFSDAWQIFLQKTLFFYFWAWISFALPITRSQAAKNKSSGSLDVIA